VKPYQFAANSTISQAVARQIELQAKTPMLEVKKLPPSANRLQSVDPGEAGGWALVERSLKQGPIPYFQWDLIDCGLVLFSKGERPPPRSADVCLVEVPQWQGDSVDRVNNLLVTACRAGHLAEATGAKWVWYTHPHTWKGSVPKDIHNQRILARLTAQERILVDRVTCAKSLLNNVVDAIGLALWGVRR
jgi:hypothetical protein